jgi:hypothetical protein
VANGKGEVLLAPTAADGVHIAAADTAGLNLDVNVVIPEWLWLELVLVELCPGLGSVDLEAGELVGVRHLVDAEQKKTDSGGGYDGWTHTERRQEREGRAESQRSEVQQSPKRGAPPFISRGIVS